MNTPENLQATTISTTSTPVVMTSKLQESVGESKPPVANTGIPDVLTAAEISDILTDGKENVTPAKAQGKSSVLAEILMASGVTSSDSEGYLDDIETQITQLTEIPKGTKHDVVEDAQKNNTIDSVDVAKNENNESMEADNGTYNTNDLNDHNVAVDTAGKYGYVYFNLLFVCVKLYF